MIKRKLLEIFSVVDLDCNDPRIDPEIINQQLDAMNSLGAIGTLISDELRENDLKKQTHC